MLQSILSQPPVSHCNSCSCVAPAKTEEPEAEVAVQLHPVEAKDEAVSTVAQKVIEQEAAQSAALESSAREEISTAASDEAVVEEAVTEEKEAQDPVATQVADPETNEHEAVLAAPKEVIAEEVVTNNAEVKPAATEEVVISSEQPVAEEAATASLKGSFVADVAIKA